MHNITNWNDLIPVWANRVCNKTGISQIEIQKLIENEARRTDKEFAKTNVNFKEGQVYILRKQKFTKAQWNEKVMRR